MGYCSQKINNYWCVIFKNSPYVSIVWESTNSIHTASIQVWNVSNIQIDQILAVWSQEGHPSPYKLFFVIQYSFVKVWRWEGITIFYFLSYFLLILSINRKIVEHGEIYIFFGLKLTDEPSPGNYLILAKIALRWRDVLFVTSCAHFFQT